MTGKEIQRVLGGFIDDIPVTVQTVSVDKNGDVKEIVYNQDIEKITWELDKDTQEAVIRLQVYA